MDQWSRTKDQGSKIRIKYKDKDQDSRAISAWEGQQAES